MGRIWKSNRDSLRFLETITAVVRGVQGIFNIAPEANHSAGFNATGRFIRCFNGFALDLGAFSNIVG